jgi:DtxR family Mn-dependent transcriptional regulator
MTVMQQPPKPSADLSQTVEDYLRTILLFKESRAGISQQSLRERFGVSLPTVSSTLKRLEREGLIYRDGRHHVQLSPLGQIAAESVMRRNRLVERFLHQILKVPFADLAGEADRIEHTVTPRVERSLYLLLDRPTTCPHGNSIEFTGEDEPSDAALAAFRSGRVTITRILELAVADADFVQWLERHELTPGNHFSIDRQASGHTVLIREGRRVCLPAPAGELIMARDSSESDSQDFETHHPAQMRSES